MLNIISVALELKHIVNLLRVSYPYKWLLSLQHSISIAVHKQQDSYSVIKMGVVGIFLLLYA